MGIGCQFLLYTGFIKGNGHTISNLVLSDTNNDSIGLFNLFAGIVEDLNLVINTNLTTAKRIHWLGAFAGYSGGIIKNMHVTGNLFVDGDVGAIGGIVGGNSSGKLINCSSSVNITIETAKRIYVGGLVGRSGTIENSFYNGDINIISTSNIIHGEIYAGGLSGGSSAIKNCYAAGTLTINSPDDVQVGGLAGEAGSVEKSYATNTINVTISNLRSNQSLDAGGLIGFAFSLDDITSSFSTSSISVINNSGGYSYVGGLAGVLYNATIKDSFSSTTMNVNSSSKNVGDIMGYNGGTPSIITNCTALSQSAVTKSFIETTFGATFNENWKWKTGVHPVLKWEQ
jgi:hypothetical protein